MTNNTTNPCLPAAPRRGKSSILHSASCTLHSAFRNLHSALKRHSAFCILHSAFLIVALAAMSADADTVPISKITSTGSASYGAGDTITINVFFDDTVTSVVGTPSLTLSNVQGTGTAKALYKGPFTDGPRKGMQFEYAVRPGDFSAGIGVSGFATEGATIGYSEDEPTSITAATLPTADKIFADETIAIRTITFETPASGSASGSKGETLPVTISLGGDAPADVSFAVAASVANKVDIPAFSIPAGSSSGTCTLDLRDKTDGSITVTFHPASYTGTDGDLTLTLTINEPGKSYAAEVLNDGSDRVYSVGETIDIAVRVAIPGQTDVAITDVSGTPYLKLDIQNQDTSEKRAIYTGEYEEDLLFFQYVVQPGDFTEDLDCVEFGLVNGTGIEVNGVNMLRAGARALPVGGAAGSLKQNASISIKTISLDDYTLARSLEGSEGDKLSVEITRREASTKVQGFTITASDGNKVDFPANFSIPRNEESAMLDIDLIEATDAGQPLELRLHPNGYSSNGGDIVLSITINAGTKPPVIITGPTQLEEGSGIAELTVALARFPRKTTTVNLSATPATGALAFLSSTTLIWAAGDENPKTVTIQPLDGDAQVTITADTDNTSYSGGTLSIFVANKNPNLISPPAEGWEPPAGGEGFAYTIGWAGRDVDADNGTLYAVIHWGDGTTTTHDGAQGAAQHIYNAAGSFGITVEMHDKDGGVSTASGTATIHHSSVGIQQHVETGASLTWIMPPPSSAAWSIVESGGTLEGPCLRSDPTGSSESAIIEATLSGAGLLTFDWRISSYRGHYARFYIDGVLTESITRLTDWGTVSAILDDGVHRLRWTYEKGSGATSNEDAAFLDNVCWQPLSLSQALDGTNIVWTSGEDAAWVPQIGVTFDGIDAVRSRAVIGMQSSRIEATVTGAGTMSWAWKASVAGIAGVDVYLDGEVLYDDGVFLDGPSDWAMASIDIQGSGRHVICFEFWNCGTESTIDDCAYLDCVTWVPKVSENVVVGNVEIPVAWLNENAASFVDGNAGAYEAAALATAANGVNKVWECYVAGLVPTNATDLFRTVISIGADGAPEISWEPDLNEGGTKQERVYTVEGRESLTDGDWGPTNAASRFFRVKVGIP